MKSRIVAIGSCLLMTALIGCGDDSSSPSPDSDAGPDGGGSVAGTGGNGGQSGAGKGGQNAGGVGGKGAGGSGEGGNGGSRSNQTYNIGGQVTGLKGTGLVLVLNDASDLSVAADGSFSFDAELEKGKDYSVAVKTQPSDPVQACAVTDGEGKVGEADIDNVKITCSDVQRSIGGNITGLGGGQIVLKNNNADDLTVTQDGTFTFKTLLQPGAGYEVTIGTSPNARTCSLTKAKGTLASTNISDVTIACYEGLTLSARARPGSVGLTWNNNGGTSYTVWAFDNASCNLDNPDACTNPVKKENVSSPYVFSELENGKVFYFHVRGNHPDSFSTRSNVAGARPNDAAFDKEVNALARGGDGTIYVGGSFSSVGAYTGPIVPLDKNTGLPSRLPGFHVFTGGSISAIVPDGTGGYFVAGSFNLEISDTNTIHNLAHVTNTGAVDPTWKPEPGPDGSTVRAIAVAGDKLYLAGNFTAVGTGQNNARAGGLAAVSTTGTGALSDWNPVVTPAAAVDTVAATASTVYVGGRFTAIGANSAARVGLAALDATTANATTFDPNPRVGTNPGDPGEVVALALSDDTLYVSGNFDNIGGSAHSQLAAVGLTGTGTATAFVASPTANNAPTSLALSGNVLYIGGNFTDIGGSIRNRLAALDKATGAVQSWDPSADDDVQGLAVSGETIYVSGDFQNIAGKARKYVAAIDKDGKLVESWDPRPNAATKAIAVDSDTVYVAGDTVVTYGAEQYARLAAFKGNSLTTWAAAVGGGDVFALAVSGDNIYFGGTFKTVGTADRNGVASLTNAAALRDWDAKLNANASVQALAANSDNVYIGGVFGTSTGNRTNLVALTTSDATIPANWAFTGTTGGGTSAVGALALDGSTLYLGGDFGNASGSSRSRLAAVDAGTGAANSWNPNASGGSVRALSVVGNVVFAGGVFTALGGNPHPALGAIDKTSGAVDSWEPAVAADPEVHTIAVGSGDALYVGGLFSTVGAGQGNNHEGVVIFDASTASPYALIPGAPDTSGTGVNALLYDNGKLYLGGNFIAAGGARCIDFCVVAFTPPP